MNNPSNIKFANFIVIPRTSKKKNKQGLFFRREGDSTFIRNVAIYRTTLRRIPEDITFNTFSSIPAQRRYVSA